jgi:hypothetical protein
MFTTWRFRAIGLVILTIALWQSRAAHFHGLGSKALLGLILLWAGGLFAVRRPQLWPWVVALMLAVSAALVRFMPGMGATLIISFGVCGSCHSWRWLKVLGGPLVLAGALWLNYPLAGWTGVVDSGITLAHVLLLGRFSEKVQNKIRRK